MPTITLHVYNIGLLTFGTKIMKTCETDRLVPIKELKQQEQQNG